MPPPPLLPTPLTFYCHTAGNNTEPVKRGLLARGGWRDSPPPAKTDEVYNVNFIWKPTWHHLRGCPVTYARGSPIPARRQMINHHRGVELLCAKDDIFKTLHSHFVALGVDPFTRIPPTYLVEPKRSDDPNEWPGWTNFSAHYARCAADPTSKNLWVVKPTSLNRGIGVEVFREIDAIREFLSGKGKAAAMGLQPTWVLQVGELRAHLARVAMALVVPVADSGVFLLAGPIAVSRFLA
jgi:hypothetical protein